MSVFYTLIDICSINGYILFTQNVPASNEKKSTRKMYLKELGQQLVESFVQERCQNLRGLQTPIVKAMGHILGRELQNEIQNVNIQDEPPMKRRCHICMKQASNRKAVHNVTKTNARCANSICVKNIQTSRLHVLGHLV